MKYGQILTFAAIFLVAALAIGTYIVLTWEGGDDGEENEPGVSVYVNSVEFTMHDMMEDLNIMTITAGNDVEYTGVSMSDLVNESGVENPEDHHYKISASDGYYRNVTWDDMLRGVLVEEETMSAFPLLPGKYRIRDVATIEPVETETISVNGRLFTWEQPFFILSSVTLMDNQSNSHEGIPLGDLINLTGINRPEESTYKITADDGYSKIYSWGNMTSGILDQDEKRAIFPGMTTSFWIRGIVSIEVE